MKFLFLTLIALFISAFAGPVIAVELDGIKNSFSSFVDETGGVESVSTVDAAVIALNTDGRFKRLTPNYKSLTFSNVGYYRTITGRYIPAFRRDGRVG